MRYVLGFFCLFLSVSFLKCLQGLLIFVQEEPVDKSKHWGDLEEEEEEEEEEDEEQTEEEELGDGFQSIDSLSRYVLP